MGPLTQDAKIRRRRRFDAAVGPEGWNLEFHVDHFAKWRG
jgi:hypothetical protein